MPDEAPSRVFEDVFFIETEPLEQRWDKIIKIQVCSKHRHGHQFLCFKLMIFYVNNNTATNATTTIRNLQYYFYFNNDDTNTTLGPGQTAHNNLC